MIYIECDADEVLIRELGFGRKQFIHEGGKFEICNRLQKVQDSIGLIEYDSGQSNPPYLNKCTLLEKSQKNGIEIYLHKNSGNKLLVIHNDLEDWIIKISNSNGVNVSDFGLEDNRDRMHRMMPGKINNFKRLVAHLVQIGIPELKYLLSKLKANN
jgi:hypothetical protein